MFLVSQNKPSGNSSIGLLLSGSVMLLYAECSTVSSATAHLTGLTATVKTLAVWTGLTLTKGITHVHCRIQGDVRFVP